MKKIEETILKACGFSVLILLLFFAFTASTNYPSAVINFSTFAVIVGFGFLISLASLVLQIKTLNVIVRFLIHYTTLLIAFCAIFLSIGNIGTGSSSKVFVAIVLFTIFYAVLLGISYLFKRIFDFFDKMINSKYETKTKAEAKKETYKSLYSSK